MACMRVLVLAICVMVTSAAQTTIRSVQNGTLAQTSPKPTIQTDLSQATATLAPNGTVKLDTVHNDAWKLDFTSCGSSKNCWFMPSNCEKKNDYSACHSIITWRIEKHSSGKRELIIEMDTRTDDMPNKYMGKYMAWGFSHDYKMGNDYVIECVVNPSGRVRSYLSFNDLWYNLRSSQSTNLLLSNTQGKSENDRISCQTTYALDEAKTAQIPNEEKWRIVDIAQPFYFFFARGDADVQTDALQMHWLMDGDLFPWIGTERIDVSQEKDVKILKSAKHYDIPRSIQYDLVKAHGIMMIFGWWVFAAIAMFISRHFKNSWPDTKLCGLPAWFQLHRSLMIISLILQCSAFALVFIQNESMLTCNHTCDDHAYSLMLHAYLGVACTAAALIQPFMALMRPSPTASKRPIFNWLHWFFGTGSFILATVTIFLSALLGKAGLRHWFKYQPDYIMAGYVVAFIVCSLLFEMIWYFRFRPEPQAPIQMSTMSGPRMPLSAKAADISQSSKTSKLQTAVLIFFGISAVALCAALSWMIASNHH